MNVLQQQRTMGGRNRKPSPDDNADSLMSEHSRIQICEDCGDRQSRLSNYFCPKCEQALCSDCWPQIHNKGARKRHPKLPLRKPKYFPMHSSQTTSITNQQSVTSSFLQDSSSLNGMQQHFDDSPGQQPVLPGHLQVQLGAHKHLIPHHQQSMAQESSKTDRGNHPYQTQTPDNAQAQYMGQRPGYQLQDHPSYQYSAYQQPSQGAYPRMVDPVQAFHPSHQVQMMPPQYAFQGHPQYFVPQSQGHQFMYSGPPHLQQVPHQVQMQMHAPPFQPQQLYPHPSQLSSMQRASPQDSKSKKLTGFSHSEDEFPHDAGIQDEAKVRMPTPFLEFDTGEKPYHAAYRHGNLNSEPRNGERNAYGVGLESNMYQIKAADTATTTTEQPQACKSFTPLRKNVQSTSEQMQSPLLRTPNEQQRFSGFRDSKFLTPPDAATAGQCRAYFMKDFADNSQKQNLVSKKRLLKMPRGDKVAHGGSYQAKPPKGPYIESQARLGKPNSLSSRDMDLDLSGDNQSANNYQQKPFDVYQYSGGGPQSSYSAKNNLRQLRKTPSSQISQDETIRDSSPGGLIHEGTYANAKSQNSSGNPSRKNGKNEGSRLINAKTAYSQKSGSGGGQSSYVPKQQSGGNLGRTTKSQRSGSGTYRQPPVQSVIMQPFLQLETKKLRHRYSRNELEETKTSENDLIRKMQQILFENAAGGELLNLKSTFTAQMTEKVAVSQDQVLLLIDRAVNAGIIHQTDRNFANAQKIEFISLKIQVLSHQCLSWVITSLRRDEMTPTESAIKNRTKEAFDFKVSNEQWDAIMHSIRQQPVTAKPLAPILVQADKGGSTITAPQTYTNTQTEDSAYTHSSTESIQHQQARTATTVSAQGVTRIVRKGSSNEADTGSGSTIQGDMQASEPATETFNRAQPQQANDNLNDQAAVFRFKIAQMPSESEGVTVLVNAIYMEDERVWTGVNIEDSSTVDRDLYDIMKGFLKDYFCAEEPYSQKAMTQKQDLIKSVDELGSGDLRMIPGGRYGCTQFLKICGPERIRQCSVGKATQMVHLAIKEDVLRHVKTQIVWSTQVDKHKTEQSNIEDSTILVQRKAKLEKVKDAIIEILAESKTGMSLAQLPQYINKKLPFNLDYNEFGFPKLKDLLQSMTDDIKVTLRDVNHPFAYLVRKQRTHASQHDCQLRSTMKPVLRVGNLSEQIEDGSSRQMYISNEKLQQIVRASYTILQMEPTGIKIDKFMASIQEQIGFSFKYQDLGCDSSFEFVKRYLMPQDENIEFILIPDQNIYTIRSKRILANYIKDNVPLDEQQQVLRQHAANRQKATQRQNNAISHQDFQDFDFGPLCFSSSGIEPSEISSDYQPNRPRHQQRIQTHPDEVKESSDKLAFERDYIPTHESIYGGKDTQSDGSSLHNHISELSSGLQKSTNQAQQQAQNTEGGWPKQHMQQPGFPNSWQPWQYQQAAQQSNDQQQQMMYQGFNHGIFDHPKVDLNLYHLPPGRQAYTYIQQVPIDQMDQEGDEHGRPQLHSQQQPHHMGQMMYSQHHNLHYGDVESPRVQDSISQLLDDSPSQKLSTPACDMSIFSDNCILNRREMIPEPDQQDQYSALLKPDDQRSVKSEALKKNPVIFIESRAENPKITEETSGSHQSTPEIVEPKIRQNLSREYE